MTIASKKIRELLVKENGLLDKRRSVLVGAGLVIVLLLIGMIGNVAIGGVGMDAGDGELANESDPVDNPDPVTTPAPEPVTTTEEPGFSYVCSKEVPKYLSTVGESDADITVAKDGSGDYTTIQAGIDSASAGDTIYVDDGIYTEATQFSLTSQTDWSVVAHIQKPITLVGSDGAVIDQQGTTKSGVFVESSHVTVQGFELRNGQTKTTEDDGEFYQHSSIRVDGEGLENINIVNNTITHSGGVYVGLTKGDNINIIANSIRQEHSGTGIYVTPTWKGGGSVSVNCNTLTSEGEFGEGISLENIAYFGSGYEASDFNAYSNTVKGYYMGVSVNGYGNHVANNTLSDGRYGVQLDYYGEKDSHSNTFEMNEYSGFEEDFNIFER